MPQENPPLLDKTMNTTESTPRNLADVLASGLANIANNVKPDGSDISISVPGMSANNVNDGFSELKQSLDALDTVDDIKYVRGKADISSTTYNTVLLKIQKFITDLVTDGHYTKFDVIINSGGRYSFQGYVYPEKNYGAGILLSYDGLIINWRRSNNTDNLYNITVTT